MSLLKHALITGYCWGVLPERLVTWIFIKLNLGEK